MQKMLRKSLMVIVSAFMIMMNMSLHVFATTNEVNVVIHDNEIEIQNEFISRQFEIKDGNISTKTILNKLAQTQLVPQEGSQDFVIGTISNAEEDIEIVAPTQALNRSNWKATVTNASGTQFSQTHVAYLFDNNLNTHPDEYKISGHPITLDIDLGSTQTVRSLSVDKRPGNQKATDGVNGTMGGFELYVSNDGVEYTPAGKRLFPAEAYNIHMVGNLYNVGDRVYANFDQEYQARYVRLVQTSTALGTVEEFTSSEINLYADVYQGPQWEVDSHQILSSKLSYEGADVETLENGKKLTIHFAPYTKNGVVWDIDQVYVLENHKQYMRTFLEISVDNKDLAQIDYIDTDFIVFDDEVDHKWCVPETSSIYSQHIGKHEMSLGQPIYANGFYMGSEFPSANTRIVDDATQIRYYSGKTFARLEADNQLTTDGKFVSWQNVIGSARQVETAIVQSDFFAYIEDIATPTVFRKQYNSWYDNMMNVTDESVSKSFLQTEAHLSANGLEPLDSYVLDDGCNNYYSVIGDKTYVNPSSSAGSNEPNRTGFWELNHKFPNELYTLSSIADKLQATFGLWNGPRGGYNFNKGFAQYLEAKGTGYFSSNSNDICVASTKYLKNLTTYFIDCQNRFDVDYWKLDGFASRPCTNTAHDHMTGGPNNAYYTTDLWEKWIDVFEAMRASRTSQGKDLYINGTSYMNLSPWLLQWINALWIQNSSDTGVLGTGERHEQKIYYRDQMYYSLCCENQMQVPLKNIYNHDPIFGVSDNSSASTEVFREFMFANAMRGTSFWELYFSPSIFDDAKWKVAVDAITWAEENQDILKNAKYYGSSPKVGVYGYSCWNDDEGIISFTNPGDNATTYSIVLNEEIGITSSIQNLTGIQVEPYATGILEDKATYNETLTVELQAHETKIYHFGKKDHEKPSVVSAKTTGEEEITVKFNERIQNPKFIINGEEVVGTLKEDYRSVVLTTPLEDINEVIIEVSDFNGNILEETQSIVYYKDDIIASVSSKYDVNEKDSLKETYDSFANMIWLEGFEEATTLENENVLSGTSDFSITCNVKTTDTNVELFNSNDEVILSIDEEGYVTFKVASQTLSSKEEVITVLEKAHGTINTDAYVPTSTEVTYRGNVNDGNAHVITAVREANGVLKMYIDGELTTSLYHENKVNEALVGGTMTIADASFSGAIANVQVINRALMYDESPKVIESQVPRIYADRSTWSGSACSEENNEKQGDYGVSAAFDNDTNTRWHTNYTATSDTCDEGTHWIKIDFNKAETFDMIHYTGRAGLNGDMKGYQIDLYDEAGNIIKTINGELSVPSVENNIVLDQEYTAHALKITFLSTQNGNHFASVTELNVSKAEPLLSEEEVAIEVERLLAKVEDINLDYLTKDSREALEKMISKISNITDVTLSIVEQLESELDDVLANLVYREADYTKVKEAISQANALNKEEYLNFSIVEAAMNVVVEGKDIREQASVDAMAKTINDAIKALVKLADKTSLDQMIAQANTVIESDKVYTEETMRIFEEAYRAALEVQNKVDATQAEVDQASSALANVMNALKEKEVEAVTNLAAEDTNYKTITLTWDASEYATSYDVYRKSYKEDATFEYEATVTEPTYASTGVMTGKEYAFYVVAKNENSVAQASDIVTMATTLKGTVTLAMEQVSISKFKLSWNKVDGATRYIVYRKRNDDKMLKVLTLGGNDLEYVTAEMPNGDYTFQVRAGRYDSKDRVMTKASNKVSGSVEALKPTVTVTAGTKSAKICWKKMEGVTHYQVYRATSSTGKYTKLVTTKELSYTAKSLTAGKKYYFKVRGYKTYKSGTDIKYSVYTPYSSIKSVTAK